jgi:SAM-dependent methyltransferase
VSDERIRVVEQGYDVMADRFLEWSQGVEGDPRPRLVERFMEGLPDGAAVVDLGCGAGVPTTARLAERFAVTGVDVSAEQLRRARALVPEARFVRADMTEFDAGEGSVDGVTACYSLTHLPAAHQPEMLRRIAGWLRPGGRVLASLGTGGDRARRDRDDPRARGRRDLPLASGYAACTSSSLSPKRPVRLSRTTTRPQSFATAVTASGPLVASA